MGLFAKNKLKASQKAYEAKMKEAMEAQRKGDIQGYAALNEEAEELLQTLQGLKGTSS
jgi:hypothetical protein